MTSLIPVVAVVLSGASTPRLMPAILQLPVRPPFLALTTATEPEDQGHHFSTPWLVAGVAGGAATGFLTGTAVAARCHGQGGSEAGGIGLGLFWAAAGSLLGVGAANGSSAAKIGVVVVDVLGPIGGVLAHGCP